MWKNACVYDLVWKSVMTRCIADTNNRQVLTIQTKMNLIGKYNHYMTKRIYIYAYLLFYLTEIYIVVVYCIYAFIDGVGKFYYNNVSSVMTRCIADTNNRQVLTIQAKMNLIGKYNHYITKRIYICIHICYFT